MSIPGVTPLNSIALPLTAPGSLTLLPDLTVSVAEILEPATTPADAVVSFSEASSEQNAGFVERVGPQQYLAFYAITPGEETRSFEESTRRGVVEALTRTQVDGKQTVILDYDSFDLGVPVEEKFVLTSILGGIRTYAQMVYDGERPAGLNDVVVAMGKSACFAFEHIIGREFGRLMRIKQPIVVDMLKGEQIPEFDVNDPPDVTVTWLRKTSLRERPETVHLVNTTSMFRKLVTWKMAFVVYRQWERYFLWLSNWQNGERASPHDIIYDGRNLFIDRFGDWTRGGLFEKGYISSQGHGHFTLEELGGSPYRTSSGMNVFRDSGKELSAKGQQLKSIFTSMGIMVEFGRTGHSIHPEMSARQYGPR